MENKKFKKKYQAMIAARNEEHTSKWIGSS